MIIRNVSIDRYGVCNDTQLSELKNDVIVIHGPNEAGKTTCMEFIRGIFYGLAGNGREKYVRGIGGDRFGGNLTVETDEEQAWRVQREHVVDSPEELDRLEILVDGQLHSASTMNRELLRGVDHEVFKNVFTVGLGELQHLNLLNATEAAEHLYEMTTGIDRVSLGTVLRTVAATRRDIYAGPDVASEIVALHLRVGELQKLIQGDYSQSQSWAQLQNELSSAAQDILSIETRMEAMEVRKRVLETAFLLRDSWRERTQLQKRLEGMSVPARAIADMIAENSMIRLRSWNSEVQTASEKLDDLGERRKQLKSDLAAIEVNRRITENAARIQAVCEHSSWLASLRDQIESLSREVSELKEDAQRGLADGLIDQVAGSMPVVDQQTLRALRQPESELRHAEERMSQCEKEMDVAADELRQIENEWFEARSQAAPELLDGGPARGVQLETRISENGRLVANLRKRMSLEQQVERLDREIQAIDQRQLGHADELPSAKTLIIAGSIFMAGFALLVTGLIFGDLFALEPATATFIAALGTAGLVSGVAYRFLDSYNRAKFAEVSLRRRTLLRQQREQSQQEVEVLAVAQAPAGALLDVQLRELEKKQVMLESLIPQAARLRGAQAAQQLAQSRLEESITYRDDAISVWESALSHQSLPAGMQVNDIHTICDNSESLATQKRRLDDRKAELQRRQSDACDLALRIEQILFDLQLEPESSDPAEQIRQLNRVLTEQRLLHKQRKGVKKKVRRIKRQMLEVTGKMQQAQTQMNRVFVSAGVTDLHEMESLAREYAQTSQLQHHCHSITEHIESVLKRENLEVSDLQSSMDVHDEGRLQDELETVIQELGDCRGMLANAHEDQGQRKLQLKQLAKNQSLAEARMELACVNQRLLEAQNRWRIWAAAEYALEQVRRVYENERQPATLIDASKWLEKMSAGKYVRIWTPLDEDALYIDGADGQTWGLETLSRGTRESVFICLRLALVNSYAKNGVQLPLILDDVLVNCDTDRAEHAVSMLTDFASDGPQVFFFTCHQHLAEYFGAAGADVRSLEIPEVIIAPAIQRSSDQMLIKEPDDVASPHLARDEKLTQRAADELVEASMQSCDVSHSGSATAPPIPSERNSGGAQVDETQSGVLDTMENHDDPVSDGGLSTSEAIEQVEQLIESVSLGLKETETNHFAVPADEEDAYDEIEIIEEPEYEIEMIEAPVDVDDVSNRVSGREDGVSEQSSDTRSSESEDESAWDEDELAA
ncbi:MAG: AAA family ATPase [Planctomycetota bacterium]|nr:AAA family ATPase [Planctomycetota bacterium]